MWGGVEVLFVVENASGWDEMETGVRVEESHCEKLSKDHIDRQRN